MKIKQGFLCLAQVDKLARAERTLLHKGEWVHGTSHPEGGGGQRSSFKVIFTRYNGEGLPLPFYQHFRKRCAVPRSRVQSSKPGWGGV